MPLDVTKDELSNRLLRMRENLCIVFNGDIIKEIRSPYKLKNRQVIFVCICFNTSI